MPKHDNSAAFREGISYFREFQTTLREAAANALSPIPLVAAVELEELYSTTEIMSGAVTAELTGLSPQVGVGNFIVSRAAVQADRQRHSGFFQRLKVKQPPKQGSPEYKHWKMTIYARRVLLAGAEPSQAFAAQYVQTLGTCPPGVQQAQNQHQSERQQRAGRQRHTEEEREAERQRQAENQREARRQAEKEREAERRQEEQQREQAARAEGAGRRHDAPSGKISAAQALEVLGLKAGATEEEIRTAYNRLMKRVHPDVGGSNFFAKQLNDARDVLLGQRAR